MDENNQQHNNGENLKTVRTYLSDMADTVRQNEISVIKVALAEQNKHEREDIYKKIEGTPAKKTFWFIGGLLLIAVAIFGVYYILKQKAIDNTVVEVVKEESIISYDANSFIDATNTNNLVEKVNSLKKDESVVDKENSIRLISITKDANGVKEKLGVPEIFSKMNFTAPSSLIRSLSPSYMIGMYNKKLFLIFQTKDYEYTYAGMLEWEKTMARDMFYLFELNTKESVLELSTRQWKDIIINNKDSRVLSNESDVPILYYMFNDKNNLIIADSEDTIKEIIARLIIKNIKPL